MTDIYQQRAVSGRKKGDLVSLTERYRCFAENLHELKDKCRDAETQKFFNVINDLNKEMDYLREVFEKKKADLEYQLEEVATTKNEIELQANSLAAQNDNLNSKLTEEQTSRKKLENALADAHRLLGEKDSCIQDCRITIAQVQNSLVEVQKEKDEAQDTLTQTRVLAETEAKGRKDYELMYNNMQNELEFRKNLYEKEIQEIANKLSMSEQAILVAGETIKKHECVDEKFADMIAKVRLDTEYKLCQFQIEAEANYQASIQDIQAKLDAEIQKGRDLENENIELKSKIDEWKSNCGTLQSKAEASEKQCSQLIRELQSERQQSACKIRELEATICDLERRLHEARQEVTTLQNATIPMDADVINLHQLISSEEERIKIMADTQRNELQRTNTGDLYQMKTAFSTPKSKPSSPVGTSRTPRNESKPFKLPPLTGSSQRIGSPPKSDNKYDFQSNNKRTGSCNYQNHQQHLTKAKDVFP